MKLAHFGLAMAITTGSMSPAITVSPEKSTYCEMLDAPVNGNMLADFQLVLKNTKLGDHSFNGKIIEIVAAKDEQVCQYLGKTIFERQVVKIHDNKGDSGKPVCGVKIAKEYGMFPDMKKDLEAAQKKIGNKTLVTIFGIHYYASSGDGSTIDRMVCTLAEVKSR